ncbi:M48 family metalloprotease [Candidatus Woesearchaeota archaeon]|nr:M48 family metalloprotease [Candidatus Woesearchaeota archaeon]
MRIAFDEVRANKLKSWLLILLFAVVISALGAAFGLFYGSMYFGVALALIAAVVYSLIMLGAGDSMILGMSGAKPVTKKELPHLYHAIEGLSIAAGIPAPKAYVIDDSALNAFATGRDPKHASVTVTSGLLKAMNRQELEGVIAHEMSHIKNLDIRFMMLTVVLVGVVTLMSQFLLRSFLWGGHRGRKSSSQVAIILILAGLLLAILSPVIGEMIKLAVSRKREFMADAGGAVLTRYPAGLAGALKKIANDPDPLVDKANQATAHLFISTPFRKSKGFLNGLFMTHPPIGERVRRLEEM